VLIAGDGDYVPLVRKLHTLGTQVMLICWDFSWHNENGDIVETKTSRQLLSEVFFPVQMHLKIEQNNSEYIKDLFVPEKPQETVSAISPAPGKPAEPAAIPAEEYTSTIFSINPNGYGFIKDEEKNNIFFHYSRLTNCDFSELGFGMEVRYMVEEDAERSKREEIPCYRATKVTLVKEQYIIH
jgi:cold shock CspA family protein